MGIKKAINLNAVYLCLCNLNPFGIGYLIAGKKRRFLATLLANFVLLAAGQLINASRKPVIWAVIFMAVFLATAVDLWFLIQKEPDIIPQKFSKSVYILPGIALILAILFYGGFFFYRRAGSQMAEKGLNLYEQRDYAGAFQNLYSTHMLYRLSLNPQVVAIEDDLEQISILITSQYHASQGDYEQALKAIDTFEEVFPNSDRISDFNNFGVDYYIAWAEKAQTDGDYRTCQATIKKTRTRFTLEAEARQVELDEILAENYLKWGESLIASGDYQEAIEKLEMVVINYFSTESFDSAHQKAAQAHYDLAAEHIAKKGYNAAMEQYEIIEKQYASADIAPELLEEMPDFLFAWGDYLRNKSSFLAAIEKYEQTAEYDSNDQILTKIEDEVAQTHALLANDSGADGKTIIKEAAKKACNGEVVESTMIDLYPEEQGKAKICYDSKDSDLPNDLVADTPASLRYVVDYEIGSRRLQTCAYMGGYTLERWQASETYTITYVKTGKKFAGKTFYGSAPDACPEFNYFSSSVEKDFGGSVLSDDVQQWLEGVLR